ncbi:DNA repair protein [Planktotalea sp.]|uniref:DNA repair protein n=1 Tax=Planktotalea sp. TaxID=2029877 RepID=UPI00329A41A4
MSALKSVYELASWLMQRLTFFLLIGLAATAIALTVASAFGFASWIEWPLQIGEQTYPWAGMAAQIAGTVLLVGLCFFLPAHKRITQLETSHRQFQIGMDDVARAYAVAHAQDRTGAFKLSGEFDAIRERLGFLRDHPDLATLEPTVLEAAAQMSHISAEMANIYSDRKVDRARQVLKERQHEIAEFNLRLEEAKVVSTELKSWLGLVEMEESVAHAQLDRLKDDLADVLPALGLEIVGDVKEPEGEVIDLPLAAE